MKKEESDNGHSFPIFWLHLVFWKFSSLLSAFALLLFLHCLSQNLCPRVRAGCQRVAGQSGGVSRADCAHRGPAGLMWPSFFTTFLSGSVSDGMFSFPFRGCDKAL